MKKNDACEIEGVGDWSPLTLLESRHGEDTREHALVVTVQNSTDTGERGDGEHTKVLHEGASATRSHQRLTTVQDCIVNGCAAFGLASTESHRSLSCIVFPVTFLLVSSLTVLYEVGQAGQRFSNAEVVKKGRRPDATRDCERRRGKSWG